MLLLHRWFGLLAGIWLFVVALTGIVLVFQEELDHALNPEIFDRPAIGDRRPVEQLVRAAESSIEGSYARFVNLPNSPHAPMMASLTARPGTDAKVLPGTQTFVDPYTGAHLGTRVFGAFQADRLHIVPWIYKLHYTLHLGNFGGGLLGFVALFWMLDHLPSVWLSFPALRGWWRSFLVRRTARGVTQAFSLHRASGLWLLPVTLVLAVSGVYFNLNVIFRPAVDAVLPLTQAYHQTAPRLDEPIYVSHDVPIDRALDVARRATDGAEVDSLILLPAQGVYWFRIFDPRDMADYGQRYVYVGMRDGAVLADQHRTEGSAGDVFLALQFPLHSGKLFGWPGRLLIAFTGVAICGLVTTGFIMWWKRRRGRVAMKKRMRDAEQARAPQTRTPANDDRAKRPIVARHRTASSAPASGHSP
ncbi:MAG: PepSY-associated TM helix domain-containing protein [Acidobacteriota bacterium]